MSTQLAPYLHFRDNARQAMEFYKSVLGGELTVSTFADFHASDDPAEADKVMHAQLTVEGGPQLMASDTPKSMEYQPGSNFALSLAGEDEPTLRGYWEKLSDGGTVSMPLDKAPWGDVFGMCVDKFGVSWMVNISGEQESAG